MNLNLSNKFQWNPKENQCIFIQENKFENVVSEIASILYRPQYVKNCKGNIGEAELFPIDPRSIHEADLVLYNRTSPDAISIFYHKQHNSDKGLIWIRCWMHGENYEVSIRSFCPKCGHVITKPNHAMQILTILSFPVQYS